MTELSPVVRAINFVCGSFSGWWLGEDDGRPHEPYIRVDRWDEELRAAGFSGVETAVYEMSSPTACWPPSCPSPLAASSRRKRR